MRRGGSSARLCKWHCFVVASGVVVVLAGDELGKVPRRVFSVRRQSSLELDVVAVLPCLLGHAPVMLSGGIKSV